MNNLLALYYDNETVSVLSAKVAPDEMRTVEFVTFFILRHEEGIVFYRKLGSET
jgi:hypothetical protein